MGQKLGNRPSMKKLGPIGSRRRAAPTGAPVQEGPSPTAGSLLVTLTPALPGVALADWARRNRERLEELLLAHGGVLFRGFDVPDAEAFREVVSAGSGDPLEYTYRSTPRSEVGGNVYTSTEYPADQTIPMHNEMSYTSSWPLKLWFGCLVSARSGGDTPLADSREVYRRLDPALIRRFETKRVTYVRNYGEGLDLPWQVVFQTSDRAEVEGICRSKGIELEWLGADRLRTRQTSQATARHLRTGEPVWFNQAHLFHVSSLPPAIRESLLAVSSEEGLPRNSCYGDGTPFEESVLEEIRHAYDQTIESFSWQDGDVLLLDNMLVAHGRRPFEGERKVVVGMAQEVHAPGTATRRES